MDIENGNGKYLEVKSCRLDFDKKINNLITNFNETSVDKAIIFKEGSIDIAMGIFDSRLKLYFIVTGNNPHAGNYLIEKIKEDISMGRRIHPRISIYQFVYNFGFRIKVPSNRTPKQVMSVLEEFDMVLYKYALRKNLIY